MDNKDQIAAVAYELYLKSGKAEGRDVDNWLEAERIVLARQSHKVQAPVVKPAPARKPADLPDGKKGSIGNRKRAR